MTRIDHHTATHYINYGLQTAYVIDDGRTLTAAIYYTTNATREILRLAQSITLYAPSELPKVRDLMLQHLDNNPLSPSWDCLYSHIDAIDSLDNDTAHILSARVGSMITYILAL